MLALNFVALASFFFGWKARGWWDKLELKMREFVYLEHGAHWGIGTLAALMLVSTLVDIPRMVMASTGLFFIGCALLSSILKNRAEAL